MYHGYVPEVPNRCACDEILTVEQPTTKTDWSVLDLRLQEGGSRRKQKDRKWIFGCWPFLQSCARRISINLVCFRVRRRMFAVCRPRTAG